VLYESTLYARTNTGGVFYASLGDESPAVAVEGRGKRIILWGQLRQDAIPSEKTALLPNYPNPFNPDTWIPFQLSEPSEVTIRIYNPHGELVRTLDLGHRERGDYRSRSAAAHWDGRNAVGESVGSGIFMVEFRAGDYREIRRAFMVK
jgi:hypothetical protein